MSHYRVAVFANNPYQFDELLAPYSETDEEYFEFMPLDDDGYQFARAAYDRMPDDVKPESFERFLTDEGYVNDPVSGEVGYMANPNAKWDYYTLDGGDWMFSLKKGEQYDKNGNARKNQFNYKDDYPYAFITPDGEWHAPGRVGWFAMSDDTPESIAAYEAEWKAWIASPENPYVNFVDCHI